MDYKTGRKKDCEVDRRVDDKIRVDYTLVELHAEYTQVVLHVDYTLVELHKVDELLLPGCRFDFGVLQMQGRLDCLVVASDSLLKDYIRIGRSRR